MSLFVIIIKNFVIVFLTAVQFAMLARAILSWFPMNSNKLMDFLYAVTEPFIYPVRMLFDKMNWFSGMPIDISFLVSYLLITIVLIILPQV
ncbi:MAG: YggT family protein [Clostridia bacterium]|nr:YggT family protein [Clostridia bacterium]